MENRLEELKELVKKGSVTAAFDLAEAFKWGYYGQTDPHRAARMYRICCRSRNGLLASQGYYNLGVLYYHGFLNREEPGKAQPERAFHCFLKSVMTHPNPSALSRLGDMYRYGQFVERNERVALALYVKAAAPA